MAIRVTVHGDRYMVAVGPPENAPWQSSEPLTAYQVMRQLNAMGCHTTDILDALNEADPNWGVRYDEEVHRRRATEGQAGQTTATSPGEAEGASQ